MSEEKIYYGKVKTGMIDLGPKEEDKYLPGSMVPLSKKDYDRLLKKGVISPGKAPEEKSDAGDMTGKAKALLDASTVEGGPELSPEIRASLEAVVAGEVIGSGKPKVETLEAILKREMDAKERDAIWKDVEKLLSEG
ncbi:MAG: hypothetical protein OEV42_14700 [Deltaproteobacteria bacterium]|nr:hypothetical protein [Deltaproteobacteria bacterium]